MEVASGSHMRQGVWGQLSVVLMYFQIIILMMVNQHFVPQTENFYARHCVGLSSLYISSFSPVRKVQPSWKSYKLYFSRAPCMCTSYRKAITLKQLGYLNLMFHLSTYLLFKL